MRFTDNQVLEEIDEVLVNLQGVISSPSPKRAKSSWPVPFLTKERTGEDS